MRPVHINGKSEMLEVANKQSLMVTRDFRDYLNLSRRYARQAIERKATEYEKRQAASDVRSRLRYQQDKNDLLFTRMHLDLFAL